MAQRTTARGIYFIASYPRSGNTWVRTFLFVLLRDLGFIPPPATLRHLSTYLPWDISGAILKGATGADECSVDIRTTLQWRPRIHRWIAAHWPTVPIVKTHSVLRSPGYQLFDFAITKGAVYLVRNPLDVVPSLAALTGISTDEAATIASTENYIRATEQNTKPEIWGTWRQNVESWIGYPRAKVLRYEDLVSDPIRTFTEVCTALRIDASQQQIAKAVEATTADRMRSLVKAGALTVAGIRKDVPLGIAAGVPPTAKLPPDLIERICCENRPLMERFGYA